MKKIFTLTLLAAIIGLKANAQSGSDALSQLFKGSPDDVNKLINAYSVPLFKGFGNSLNGGWTNTAQTQGLLHFTLRITASGSIVPDADKKFDINSLGLANIKPTNASQSTAATFGGNSDLKTGITYTDPNNPLAKVNTNLPGGVISIIPAPQVQLTVGLIHNTDVTLRYIPTINISDNVGSVGMYGFGLKHDIAQDFGTASNLIPFSLAVAVGYTHVDYNLPLSIKPDANNGGTTGSQDYSNQKLDGHFSGWNAQVILSKKILFFTPFVSAGYVSSTTNVGVKGNIPFVTGADITGKPKYTTFTDPITISGSAVGTSSARADIGFQLSLAFFKFYASYSFAQYQSFNGGIGFGF